MKFPTRETVKGVVDMVGVPEDEALNVYQGRGGFGHGVLDERIVVTNSRSAVSRGEPVTIKLHVNSTITSWIRGISGFSGESRLTRQDGKYSILNRRIFVW